MSISQRIRTAREAKGLSQAELAHMVGVTRGACGHWEQGKTSPNLENLAKVAVLLGIRFEWLATGRGPQEYDPAIPDELPGLYPPQPPRLDAMTRDMIEQFSRLPPSTQSRLVQFLRSIPDCTQ